MSVAQPFGTEDADRLAGTDAGPAVVLAAEGDDTVVAPPAAEVLLSGDDGTDALDASARVAADGLTLGDIEW